jgi:hypothetical protein
MNRLKRFLKSSWSKILPVALALALVATGFGLEFHSENVVKDNGTQTVGIGNKVFTIGTAEAAGTADYICTGTNDNLQIQAAMNALPNIGGELVILSGSYSFSATVTRAIDNITVVGMGNATSFAYNGVNPVFTASGNGWTFENLSTDAGGINMGATTGWNWYNVTAGSTVYTERNPSSSVIGGTITGTQGTFTTSNVTTLNGGTVNGTTGNFTSNVTVSGNLTAATGRTATYVIAASDAPTQVKAQADYIADGTATQLQGIINALSALAKKSTIKFMGDTFTVNGKILPKPYVDVDLNGATLTYNLASDGDVLEIINLTNSVWSNGSIIATGTRSNCSAVYVSGTTDSTAVLRNIKIINSSSGSSAHGLNIYGTASVPVGLSLENVYSQGGGGAGSLGAQIMNYNGLAQSVYCQGGTSHGIQIGGTGGGQWDNLLAKGGTGSDAEGISIQGEASPTMNSPHCIGGTGGGDCVGIDCNGGGSPILNNPIAELGTGTSTNAFALDITISSAPIITGGYAGPQKVATEFSYNSANNGRFQPMTNAFQLKSLFLYVGVANAGKTLDIGTSAGGHQVAQNIDIGTTGFIAVALLTQPQVAAGGYLYATPSGAIANDDVIVEYVVYYNENASGGAIYNASSGYWKINGLTAIAPGAWAYCFRGNNNAVSACTNFVIANSLLEHMDVAKPAVSRQFATDNVPIYNSVFRGTLENITSFAAGTAAGTNWIE